MGDAIVMASQVSIATSIFFTIDYSFVNPIIAKFLTVGAASSPRFAPGSFRVLLTPLTYIPVGDGAPTGLNQNHTNDTLMRAEYNTRSPGGPVKQLLIQHNTW
jgi:hypothetical protein